MQKGTFSFVLVHGFLDAGEIWRPIVGAVSPIWGGEWMAPDLPGMGMRWQDGGPFTLARFGEELATYIDGLQSPVILIGHSMGAQLVELAARLRPERVRGLVLLSPIPLAGTHMSSETFNALASSGGDIEAQRVMRQGLTAQPADSAVLEWLIALGRNVRRDTTHALVAAWNEGLPEGRTPSVFTGPVLVAAGAADGFTTQEMAASVAARFTGASEELLPGCGHWPHAERPALVAALIARFVASLSASAEPTSQSGAKGWTSAFIEHSSKIFADTLAPSVMFEASVLARVVQGRERVQTILTAASGLYEALDFTRRTVDGDRTYLEWEAKFGGGEHVAGVTILTTDAVGKISAIAIHHRPLPNTLRFSAQLGHALTGKIEADLFYSAQ
jgi:pimeloyl-ACP methyl ester carboxylesterase